MKSIVLSILCSIMLSNAYGQEPESVPKHPVIKGNHTFGFRAGFVAGIDNILVTGANAKRDMVPGFSAGGYYQYQRKRFIVVPELSFSRQGGAYKITSANFSYPGSTIIVDQKASYVLYNFNIKAFVGAKVKGFVFYGGPAMAVQIAGDAYGSSKYTAPVGIESSSSFKFSKIDPVLPELAAGIGYDLPIGKSHKHGITFDIQYCHALIKSTPSIDYPFYGNYVFRNQIASYYDEALMALVGFRF